MDKKTMDTILRRNPGAMEEKEGSSITADVAAATANGPTRRAPTTAAAAAAAAFAFGSSGAAASSSLDAYSRKLSEEIPKDAPYDINKATLSISLLSILKSVYILACPYLEPSFSGSWIALIESSSSPKPSSTS